MANRPAPVKQADVTRYIRGAQACGIVVGVVRVLPDGTVELIPKGSEPSRFSGPDPDELLR